ncbi:MAG TPA: metallophosphoesterase [Pyrinomonadaceae bacterium]|nr:metallophosphoesterase [Pyrinomonadaceae bacterium]
MKFRKKFGTRILAALAALVLVCLSLWVWAFLIEPNRLILHKETLVLENWPKALDSLRVAVISDIHAGSPFIDSAKLQKIVATTNQTNPDLILILGDLMITDRIYKHPVDPETIAGALKGLHARLGVYAVLGNHDWWFDGRRVWRALEEVGIRVLENDVTQIQVNGHKFWLWGLSDLNTRPQNIAGTFQRIPPNDAVIAMTHNPDIFPDIPASVALTLAGHTHGGQVNLPFAGRMIVPSRFGQKYAAGHIQEGNRHLFVTTGIGTSILPVRFRVPPEIVLLTLKSR